MRACLGQMCASGTFVRESLDARSNGADGSWQDTSSWLEHWRVDLPAATLTQLPRSGHRQIRVIVCESDKREALCEERPVTVCIRRRLIVGEPTQSDGLVGTRCGLWSCADPRWGGSQISAASR